MPPRETKETFMISKRSLQSACATVIVATMFFAEGVFAADAGDDNPTGVSGIYNGNVTDGGSWDPLTGNVARFIDDIVVPGSVGAYPLKWTRYWNSRAKIYYWGYSYKNYKLAGIPPSGWISGTLSFPDGREIRRTD